MYVKLKPCNIYEIGIIVMEPYWWDLLKECSEKSITSTSDQFIFQGPKKKIN